MNFRSSSAHGRYNRRLFGSMFLYVAVLLPCVWLIKHAPPPGALRYAAALAPALPLLGAIYAMGAYLLEETDEFRRSMFAQALLWGTGLTLAFTTVWGFLQEFSDVPQFSLYLV